MQIPAPRDFLRLGPKCQKQDGLKMTPSTDERSYAERLEDEAPKQWAPERRRFVELLIERHPNNSLMKSVHWRAFAKDLGQHEGGKVPKPRPETLERLGPRPSKHAPTMDVEILTACGNRGWSYQQWWDHQARLPYRFEAIDLLFEDLWTATFDRDSDEREGPRALAAIKKLPSATGIRRLRRAIPRSLVDLLAKIPRAETFHKEPWSSFLSHRLTTGKDGGPILIMRDLFPGLSGWAPGRNPSTNTPALRMISTLMGQGDRTTRVKVFNLSLKAACLVTSDLLRWYLDMDCDGEKLRKWYPTA